MLQVQLVIEVKAGLHPKLIVVEEAKTSGAYHVVIDRYSMVKMSNLQDSFFPASGTHELQWVIAELVLAVCSCGSILGRDQGIQEELVGSRTEFWVVSHCVQDHEERQEILH
jgi:hypothetical protein